MTAKLTLEAPVMQEAQKLYEASKIYREYKTPFVDLLDAYNKNYDLDSIGRLFGMGYHTAWYLFREYFRKISARKPEQTLYKQRRRARTRCSLEQLEFRLDESTDMRFVLQKARNAGCVAQAIPRKDTGLVASTKLAVINHRACSVQGTRSKRKKSAIYLSRAKATEVDAFILIFPSLDGDEERRLYILPQKIAWTMLFEDNSIASCPITTPGAHCSGNTKFCLHGYLEAWWVVGQLK